MNAVLEIRDVSRIAPGGQALLQPTSFVVEQGMILAIAGPNGAGKTTLLNLMCGITEPSSGSILLRGRDLAQTPALERARQIAVVGQQDMPDGRLTLNDYVMLGQIPIQADRSAEAHQKALQRTLEITGLTNLSAKKMGVLSGGERQRAHIARALAQEPSILFLDEPTNHLDPDAKGRMLSLVAGLGITVVMVLHDLVLIPEFTTHAALLKDTRLVHFGPAQDVLTPEGIKDIFCVDYLQFQQGERMIPALDIRNTSNSVRTRSKNK